MNITRRFLTTTASQLKPGDVVEVKRMGSTSLGILVSSHSTSLTLIGPNGHLSSHRPSDLTYRLPAWSDSPFITSSPPISNIPFLSTDARTALEKIRYDADSVIYHFLQFMLSMEKNQNIAKFLATYKIISREEESVTVKRVAEIAFKRDDPTPGQLLSTHRWMSTNPKYFVMREDEWRVNKQMEVGLMNWFAREGMSADTKADERYIDLIPWLVKGKGRGVDLDAFIKKINDAKEAEGSSSDVVVNTVVGPESLFVYALKESGMCFVNLIQIAICPRNSPSEYRNLCEDLILPELRKTSASGSRRSPSSDKALEILILLKVWSPLISLPAQRELSLNEFTSVHGPDRPSLFSDLSTESEEWASKLIDGTSKSATSSKIALETMEKQINFPQSNDSIPGNNESRVARFSLDPRDSLAHIRQPCKSTTFVIDSTTANELDDGISIEPVDPSRPINLDDPTSNWINIHVADPTSLVDPGHPIGLAAQLHGTSTYLPHTFFPMMPEILSTKLFNLANGRNALTFSARLDSSGEIVDYKVQASVLEDVCVLNYHDADKVLSWSGIPGYDVDDPVRSQLAPWDMAHLLKTPSKASESSSVSKDNLEKLLALQAITSLHSKLRVKNGMTSQSSPECDVNITPFSSARLGPSETHTIFINSGKSSQMSPSHSLVGEGMVIAGRVAARFCIDHKIPVMYRGQGPLLEDNGDGERDRLVERVEEEKCGKTGLTPYSLQQDLIKYMSGGMNDQRPLMHYAMGIPGVDPGSAEGGTEGMVGYLKVTSPLRRYTDMIAHWHIKSALLDSKRYAFSMEQLLDMSPRFTKKEKNSKRMGNAWSKFWALEWCRRREVLCQENGVDPIEVRDTTGCVEFNEYLGVGIKSGDFKEGEGKKTGLQPIYTCLITNEGDPRRNIPVMVYVIELGVRSTLSYDGILTKVVQGSIVRAKVESLNPQLGLMKMSACD
jgi:hypothetical protein